MRSGGAVNRGVGRALNPIAKGMGSMMNKVGQGVANAVDKTGLANKLQKSGDAAQQRKEASLKANPKAAASRERGYNQIAAGASAIGQNGQVGKGIALMAKGLASVAGSKISRGLNKMSRKGSRND